MEENNNLVQSKEKSTNTKFLVALLVVVIAIAVFVFIKWNATNVPAPQKDLFADLKGTVYLTMAPEGDNAADIYTLDIGSGEIKKYASDGFVKYTARHSPSKDKLAYTAALIDRETPGLIYPHNDFLQINVLDLKTGNIDSLTRDRLYGSRLPAWSPDEKLIAYTGLPSLSTPTEDINSWIVNITDLDGGRTLIGTGSYPQWSPDGSKILYLKRDGLYLYNLNTEISKNIFSDPNDDISSRMKLILSPDKSMLAWTRAKERTITVYKITSWEPFQMEEFKKETTVDTPYFWPVFSPDGKYLIVQAIDWNPESKTSSSPRLIVFDVETMESVEVGSLDGYNFDVSFVSDWQY